MPTTDNSLQQVAAFAKQNKGKVEIGTLTGLFFWGLAKPSYPKEADTFLTILLSVLAICYYLNTFYRWGSRVTSAKEVFIYKLFHVSAPIIVIGILFTLSGASGASTLLIAGIGLLMTVIFMGFGQLRLKSQLIDRGFMYRAFVLFLLPIILKAIQLINK